jgi:hypothetical protein
VQSQRTTERLLAGVHILQIALGALFADAAFDRFTFDGTSAYRKRQQADAQQRVTSIHP